jgi:hypothetical protein
MRARNVSSVARRFLAFAFVLAAVLIGLTALNWVPGAIEPGLMARYPTIEDATSRLGLRPVYVPTYFPEPLTWPPAVVLAQTRPYQAVVMEFVSARDGRAMLVISQAASGDFEAETAIRLRAIRESVDLDVGGRSARLEAGECEDGSVCSRVGWREGEVRIVLTMRAPSVELVRIAGSMRR